MLLRSVTSQCGKFKLQACYVSLAFTSENVHDVKHNLFFFFLFLSGLELELAVEV